MAGKKKILVIDNEIDQLQIMKDILERYGYIAIVSDDWQKAMTALMNDNYDLVISDLIMPDIEGPELCEKIKALYPGTKVLAFSGHIGLYGREKLKRSGFDGVIHKPLSISDVRRKVKEAIK